MIGIFFKSKPTRNLFFTHLLIKIIFFVFFIILGLNFLLDFSFIYDQFGKNGKEFISKYLVAHKNITNLESEIKNIKRERNQFRAQKELF